MHPFRIASLVIALSVACCSLAIGGVILMSTPPYSVSNEEGGGDNEGGDNGGGEDPGGGEGPGGGGETIIASLVASRTSCTAPCAVFFDATGTTSSDPTVEPFGQIGYSFNFGDPGSGTWSLTGKSKNTQKGGPLAAHVYETPGTYVAKVRARDSSGGAHDGEYDDAQVTITVADPSVTYSGTNTICLSRNTDHTGCPSGATQTSNVNAWPSWTSNRRYLLHAGQDFSALGAINIRGLQNVQVGKYGSGANPIVANAVLESGNPNSYGHTNGNWATNITFSDLTLNGGGGSGNSHRHVLYLRVKTRGAMEFAGTAKYYYDNADGGSRVLDMEWPSFLFVVDSDIDAANISSYALTSYGRGLAIMGNEIHDITSEHPARFWQLYKSFIAHNHIYGGASNKHILKTHAGTSQTYPATDKLADNASPVTQYLVVADNIIGDSSEPVVIAVTLGAQNNDGGAYVEPCSDAIYERNVFMHSFMTDIDVGGRRMYVRANWNQARNAAANVHTGYNPNGIPPGWNGPYSTSNSEIATDDPQ